MRSLGPEARLPRGVSTLTHLEYEQGLTPRAASGTHRGHGRLLQRSAQAHRVPPGMQQRCELIMAEELSRGPDGWLRLRILIDRCVVLGLQAELGLHVTVCISLTVFYLI